MGFLLGAIQQNKERRKISNEKNFTLRLMNCMERLQIILYVTAYSTFFYFIFLTFHNLKLYFSGIPYILYIFISFKLNVHFHLYWFRSQT